MASRQANGEVGNEVVNRLSRAMGYEHTPIQAFGKLRSARYAASVG